MPTTIACVFFSLAVLMPTVGIAQVFSLPEPSPEVTAANADWQIRSEPIFHAGNFYYPAGPTIFYDGRVMVRTGIYEGIPLYADTTIEPFSIVYVPIGRNIMRPYERRREGDLAGTVGSRAPSFPIQRDGDLSVRAGAAVIERLPFRMREPATVAVAGGVATSGGVVPPPPPSDLVASPTEPAPPVVPFVARPTGNDGIWIDFEGARWFSSGPAVRYEADRFEPAGDYRGFVVYRDKIGGRENTIFVTAIANGPLAPYTRR